MRAIKITAVTIIGFILFMFLWAKAGNLYSSYQEYTAKNTQKSVLIAEKIDANVVVQGLPLSDRTTTKSGNGRVKQVWRIDGAETGKFEIIGNAQKDADNAGWSCAQYDNSGNSISQVAPQTFCHQLFVKVLNKFITNPSAIASQLIKRAEIQRSTADYRIGDLSFETDGEFYFVRRWSRM